MIVLQIKVEDRSLIKGLGRKMAAIYKAALVATARHWHAEILKRHFSPAARAEYGYEPRTEKYLRWKRKHGVGQGRFVDNWLTGQTRRWALAPAQITATSGRALVRLRLPWYVANPRGEIRNERQRRKGLPIPAKSSKRQPDKVRELTAVSPRDREELRQFAAQEISRAIKAARPVPTTTVYGR